jgi:hypothetical protein
LQIFKWIPYKRKRYHSRDCLYWTLIFEEELEHKDGWLQPR